MVGGGGCDVVRVRRDGVRVCIGVVGGCVLSVDRPIRPLTESI